MRKYCTINTLRFLEIRQVFLQNRAFFWCKNLLANRFCRIVRCCLKNRPLLGVQFTPTVAIYVVRLFLQVSIGLKSCKSKRKTPKISRFPVFYGGDYWTRTSDLLRVNGLGKLFLTVSTAIQHRRILVQNYLIILCPGVSAYSAPHCGYSCGQTRFPPD